ncbi:hypothetical protein OsI_29278 [Oryza sativa Indica Group]|uniref:CCHC-type domain-containing protein n=2 Tax=Oryza TaxID=4527 RepID=A0A0E0IBZ2_ORYNI|nr:hypothetical protein OsI_29278 [Oryza sativa Indica Group]
MRHALDFCTFRANSQHVLALIMATTVRPLNGADGYLRWKESMLLRLHTVGVAYVLFDDPPPAPAPGPASGEEESAAAAAAAAAARRKRARDDAVCRGHILTALSDRIFPDYVRHGTARAAWEAVARTYDGAGASDVARRMLDDLEFFDDDGGGGGAPATLLEQIAHAEALAAAMDSPPSDGALAHALCKKLPQEVAIAAIMRSSGGGGGATMGDVWHVARIMEGFRVCREGMEELHGKCGNCGEPGHHAGDCMG